MNEVYMFLTSAELKDIKSMKTVVEQISCQTLECSYFIAEYAENEKFCKSTNACMHGSNELMIILGTRLLKNFISGTDKHVQQYNETFDKLIC